MKSNYVTFFLLCLLGPCTKSYSQGVTDGLPASFLIKVFQSLDDYKANKYILADKQKKDVFFYKGKVVVDHGQYMAYKWGDSSQKYTIVNLDRDLNKNYELTTIICGSICLYFNGWYTIAKNGDLVITTTYHDEVAYFSEGLDGKIYSSKNFFEQFQGDAEWQKAVKAMTINTVKKEYRDQRIKAVLEYNKRHPTDIDFYVLTNRIPW